MIHEIVIIVKGQSVYIGPGHQRCMALNKEVWPTG